MEIHFLKRVWKYISRTHYLKRVLLVLITVGILSWYVSVNGLKLHFTKLLHKDPLTSRVCFWNVTVNKGSFSLYDLNRESIGSVVKRTSGSLLDEQVSITFSIKAILCDSLNKVTSSSLSPSTAAPTASKTKTTKAKSTKQNRACKDSFLTVFEKKKQFLCFQTKGRFGNQMFAFASAYGIARHLNRTLVVDKRWPLLKTFKINATVADACVCQHTKTIKPKLNCSFDETLFNIPNNGNYKVNSYLQSWIYFSNVTKEVKQQFTFNDDITSKALVVINKVKEEYSKRMAKSKNSVDSITLIGIHNRLGRLVGTSYKVAPKEYIINAMNYFRSNFTNIVFIVCSDTIAVTQESLKGQTDVFFVEGNTPEVDMRVLTFCNSTIMTVGTFGWFSAFLADGITVYYKHPHKMKSSLRRQFSANYTDYFYPGWIAME